MSASSIDPEHHHALPEVVDDMQADTNAWVEPQPKPYKSGNPAGCWDIHLQA